MSEMAERVARIATFLKVEWKPGTWVQASCDEPPRWRVMVDGRQVGLFCKLADAEAAALSNAPRCPTAAALMASGEAPATTHAAKVTLRSAGEFSGDR